MCQVHPTDTGFQSKAPPTLWKGRRETKSTNTAMNPGENELFVPGFPLIHHFSAC